MRSESDIRILRCALSTGNGELKNTSFAAQPQIGVNPAAFLIFCEAGACYLNISIYLPGPEQFAVLPVILNKAADVFERISEEQTDFVREIGYMAGLDTFFQVLQTGINLAAVFRITERPQKLNVGRITEHLSKLRNPKKVNQSVMIIHPEHEKPQAETAELFAVVLSPVYKVISVLKTAVEKTSALDAGQCR